MEKTQREKDSAFRVVVRVRPLTKSELTAEDLEKGMPAISPILLVEDNLIFVKASEEIADYARQKAFCFHLVFSEADNNRTVFSKTVQPLIGNLLNGINITCFAYGMTGSGKTHTMLGDIYHNSTGEPGICSLAINSLFDEIKNNQDKIYQVRMSYLEIYNEHTRDLLIGNNDDSLYTDLLIVEDPKKGIVVQGLTEYEIKSPEELLNFTLKGNQYRTMASTRVNQFSSRSHAIIYIVIESRSKVRGVTEEVSYAKFSIVDLAGCERAAANENKGIRMLEGAKINRSLLALGNCINKLSEKIKTNSTYVPYRDSKLTRLLKDSLGGNTKTVMIACVSPGDNFYEETINTLKYAERASCIRKTVTKNIREVGVHISQYKEIIDSLRNEITSLKSQLLVQQKDGPEQKNIEIDKDLDSIEQEIKKAKDNFQNLISGKQIDIIKNNIDEPVELKNSLNILQEIIVNNKEWLSCMQKRINYENKQDDIELIVSTIKGNENIKKSIEHTLEKHAKWFLDKVCNRCGNLIDAETKNNKSLMLEKMELEINNLESKKKIKYLEKENDDKCQLIIAMRKDLDSVKEQLKDRELELTSLKFNYNQQNIGNTSYKPVIRKPKIHRKLKKSNNEFAYCNEIKSNNSPGMTISLKNINTAIQKNYIKNKERSKSKHKKECKNEACFIKTFTIQTKEKNNGSMFTISPKKLDFKKVEVTDKKQNNINKIEELNDSQERRKSLLITDKCVINNIPLQNGRKDSIVIKAVLTRGHHRKKQKNKEIIQIKPENQEKHGPQVKNIYVDLKQHKINPSMKITLSNEVKETKATPREPPTQRRDRTSNRSISLNPPLAELRNRRKKSKKTRREFSLIPLKDILQELGSTRKACSMKQLMDAFNNEKDGRLTPQMKKRHDSFNEEIIMNAELPETKQITRNKLAPKATYTCQPSDTQRKLVYPIYEQPSIEIDRGCNSNTLNHPVNQQEGIKINEIKNIRKKSAKRKKNNLNDDIEQLIKKQKEELREDYEKLRQPFFNGLQTTKNIEIPKKGIGDIDETIDCEDIS